MGKCRKFVLTRDFCCLVRRCRKYLGGVAKLFRFATPPIKISLYGKYYYSVFLIPILQTGALLNKNVLPSLHVTVASPVRVYPVLHFRDTSLIGGTGNCISVSIFVQLSGSPSQDSENY